MLPFAATGLVSMILNRRARASLANVEEPQVVVPSAHRITKSAKGVFAGVFTVWVPLPAATRVRVPNVRTLVPHPELPVNGAASQIKIAESEKVMSDAFAAGINRNAINRVNKIVFSRIVFASKF
jgi:hypothetical protein